MKNQYLKNIKKGQKVEILTKDNKLIKGIVEDIATTREYHPMGIMVRLSNNYVGRVQRILEEENKNEREIEKLIKEGESYYVEFKSGILWSQNLTEEEIKKSNSYDLRLYKQKASRIIIAKSIAAFLNSDGGTLIIGISENKEKGIFEIIGIEEELKKLKDKTKDGYRRLIIDEIIKPYFPAKIFNHLKEYIGIGFEEVENKTLCIIKIKRSETRVFLKVLDKEIFMIRTDSENRILEGEKLVDYCIKHFKI